MERYINRDIWFADKDITLHKNSIVKILHCILNKECPSGILVSVEDINGNIYHFDSNYLSRRETPDLDIRNLYPKRIELIKVLVIIDKELDTVGKSILKSMNGRPNSSRTVIIITDVGGIEHYTVPLNVIQILLETVKTKIIL